MKETTYTFSQDHDPTLAGREYRAYETAAAGLLVVDFGEEGAASLTHAASGIALVHGDLGKRPEELGKIAGALGGLPMDWTRDAREICSQAAQLDDLALRIFLLLVYGARRLSHAELDARR